MTALEQIQQYKNKVLQDLVDQLEEGQQNKFRRFYPDISKLEERTFDHAVFLCEKTIKENSERKENYNKFEKEVITNLHPDLQDFYSNDLIDDSSWIKTVILEGFKINLTPKFVSQSIEHEHNLEYKADYNHIE